MELEVRLTAFVDPGDAAAVVSLEGGGEQRIVLRSGRWRGTVPERALRVRLVDDDELELAPGGGAPDAAPEGPVVAIEQLFDHGVDVPPDGRLVVQLGWGTRCHHDDHGAEEAIRKRNKRFGSFEHMACASLVGKERDGSVLERGGVRAWFDGSTRVLGTLDFGDVIALAGDFYAHLDDRAVADFADAWPALTGVSGWLAGDYRASTLLGDAAKAREELRDLLIRKADSQGVAGELGTILFDGVVHGRYPARRYLALASQNFCHFGREAVTLWDRYQARALDAAAAASRLTEPNAARRAFEDALVILAFGCHFLTDAFASGHMRVPRRLLAERFGLLRGSGQQSRVMHEEDNEHGLWVTTRGEVDKNAREVWLAFGDGMLLRPEAEPHLARVREAVRVAVEELFCVFAEAARPEPGASALIPAPLGPGGLDPSSDVVSGGIPMGALQGYPLYVLGPRGRVGKRQGDRTSDGYREIEGSLLGREAFRFEDAS
jgi:hypothetical protein